MKTCNNDIIAGITEQFSNYIKENSLSSPSEISGLMRGLFDSISESISGSVSINQISSPNIVAEVIDVKTGLLFRRYLEIEYNENSNGLMFTGENINGEKAEIVFLSESAISRISELKGSGENNPPCGVNE